MERIPRPFAMGPGEGDAYWYLGGLIVYKAANEQTDGWGLSLETYPGGFASGLHIHDREDSGFYVVEGVMRVRVGDQELTAGPGGFLFLPRGVPHAFKVESPEPVSWLNIQGPTGDFRRLVQETGERATSLTLPKSVPPRDLAKVGEATKRHYLRLLGPPPF